MKKILVLLITLGALPTFASTLECNVNTGNEVFKFKQEVDISHSTTFDLGKVIEIDESLEDSAGMSGVIAKKGNIYVSLFMEHPNVLAVSTYKYNEGDTGPYYLSKNRLVNSDKKHSISTEVHIDGNIFNKLDIRCNIK